MIVREHLFNGGLSGGGAGYGLAALFPDSLASPDATGGWPASEVGCVKALRRRTANG